jgi:hypothetical protein
LLGEDRASPPSNGLIKRSMRRLGAARKLKQPGRKGRAFAFSGDERLNVSGL